jgi:alkanesulfonate monooxygenase SsuD/methylene tetrahydromethanopterin reductase-like flavin-dependent oxidoreductase (luciferase family)
MQLGIFDIHQIDPLDARDHGQVYDRKLADLATIDRLGFPYYFTAERHFMMQYRCPAATAWISAAAQRTESIRLGVLAYTLPIHSPVALAEEVAVLDWLSHGRLEVGLGLGHRIEELQALGVDPAKRIPIFQERIAIMQALWSGGAVEFDGEHTTVRNAAIFPLSQQQPHPPLWFAGNDPQAAAWAGSIGMSLATGFRPAEALRPAAEAFRAAAHHRASLDPERHMPGEGRLALMRQVYLAETDDKALDEMTDDVYRLHAEGAEPGSRASRRDEAREAVDRLVHDEIFLAGSPETIAREISRMGSELGIDTFLANVYAAAIDDQRAERALTMLARQVAPQIA